MNNAFIILIGSLGGLLWLYAILQERFKNTTSGTIWKFVRNLFPSKEPETVQNSDSSSGMMTIDALERELGIESDHYLCDRIARINEALIARRDKVSSKKKGGIS